MSEPIRWPETLRNHASHPDPISLHCAIPARMIEEVADALATLTAERDAARAQVAAFQATYKIAVERVRFLCERADEKTADGYVDAYSILDALGDV
jgi:hypothetical protein